MVRSCRTNILLSNFSCFRENERFCVRLPSCCCVQKLSSFTFLLLLMCPFLFYRVMSLIFLCAHANPCTHVFCEFLFALRSLLLPFLSPCDRKEPRHSVVVIARRTLCASAAVVTRTTCSTRSAQAVDTLLLASESVTNNTHIRAYSNE